MVWGDYSSFTFRLQKYAVGSCGDSLPSNKSSRKNMKLEKEQITEKREELCKVLVAMNRQKAKIRGNSPTASPQLPDWFPEKARRLRFDCPRDPIQSPVRFRGRANGPFAATRRGFGGGASEFQFRPDGCPGGNTQAHKER